MSKFFGIKLNLVLLLILLVNVTHAKHVGFAAPDAIVISNEVRFTILTSGTIRMEWDSLSHFNDDASFIFINRNLPVPQYTKKEKGGWLIITTDKLELKYKINSGKFTDKNVQIKYLDKIDAFLWKPGMKQKNNLKGTSRTLDAHDGETHIHSPEGSNKLQLEDGLLATDGWTIIDDSQSLLFDDSDWAWVKERERKNSQDWYFFGYGKNYKSVLYDYSLIAGKVPLPPRYAFGYWWSRFWSYSDNEMRELVHNFEKYDIPLDVLVVDMNWHYTDSLYIAPKDEFGERAHWTGWTWNKRLFPNPGKFLSWVKRKNLQTTLNLHPASGIAPYEAPYKDFAKKMKFDISLNRNIPFEGSNKEFMKTLFDVVLHPMEKEGVDFWWIDWQQWIYDKKIKTLNNTWWINYVFFSNMERNSEKRPLIYHRWGGLGNHRYQIGFSGDAIISWKSLAYQPYFTNSASNVLYGYWSHDIGGHTFRTDNDHKTAGNNYLEPELFTRWMQYGALSPIFRTHSTKNSVLNKELWNFSGEYFDALLASIHLRYQLVPYIYTMARKNYDEGISLCRPMYYDYPRHENSYRYKTQYMFGDDILVAPIGEAMIDGKSTVKVWLPEGDNWFEWHTGTMLSGGQEVSREFTIEEYPIYIKAGAIIPMYMGAKNLSVEPENMMLGVFAHSNDECFIYEDAGDSKDYDKSFSKTEVKSTYNDRIQTLTVYPRQGEYKGMPANKKYTIKLYGVEMPEKILINGHEINYSLSPQENTWAYIGKDLSVEIYLPLTNCNNVQCVSVYYNKQKETDVNRGFVKQFRECGKLVTKMKYKNARWETTDIIGLCESTNLIIQYEPEKFYEHIQSFEENIGEAYKQLNTLLNE